MMSCTSPGCYLIPWQGGKPKRLIDDYPAGPHPLGKVVYLPCGGCLACRRERRQELTLLQCLEASLHDENWFITLTYEDWQTMQLTGFPPYSLNRKHLSDFCELMRKYAHYYREDFRFFACGEYGERNERPHYHLTVFGLSSSLLGIADSCDSEKIRKVGINNGKIIRKIQEPLRDSQGNAYWQSKVISDRWPFGSHKIYRASRETMQYVAGYVTKKLTGAAGRDFRASGKVSEFQAQSRPSIGRPWFSKFCSSLSIPDAGERLVNDVVSIDGITWKCPRIFDKWLKGMDHFDGEQISNYIKTLRTLNTPLIPDRQDLKRKADFDRYSAVHYNEIKRSHNEVK